MNIPIVVARKGNIDEYLNKEEELRVAKNDNNKLRKSYNVKLENIFNQVSYNYVNYKSNRYGMDYREEYKAAYVSWNNCKVINDNESQDIWIYSLILNERAKELIELAGKIKESELKILYLENEIKAMGKNHSILED